MLVEQFEILKRFRRWDVTTVSRRALHITVEDSSQQISGHDGEWLGSMVGAWGAFLRTGDALRAREAEELIEAELWREAEAFKQLRLRPFSPSSTTLLLKLATVMTHNVGDIDQGLSYWRVGTHEAGGGVEGALHPMVGYDGDRVLELFLRYSRLAHERWQRFGGEFGRAKELYKKLLSAEGHRNYPLRECKALRTSLDLQLPFGNILHFFTFF